MRGYGGHPSEWGDPYGHGQGRNNPGAHQASHAVTGKGASGSNIAALVCSVVALVMCCNLLAVPAIVTSAMAVGRSSADPVSARKLTTWSWGILVLAFLVPISAFVVLLGVDAGNGGLDDSGF